MASISNAVIDIGTNSVKLLVAECRGGVIAPIFKASEITRLGQGTFETGFLRSEAIERTAAAVARLAKQAATFKPARLTVLATSAARSAANSGEFLRAIHAQTGLEVEIISGEREAELAFFGISSDPQFAGLPLLVFDMGGGSTEFVLGERQKIRCRHSVPLGALRLLDKIMPSDPPTSSELKECRCSVTHLLARELLPILDPGLREFRREHLILVGTGGNLLALANVIASMAGAQPGAGVLKLALAQVQATADWLWGQTMAQRLEIPEIPALRADIVLPAIVIVESILRVLGFESLRVSEYSLRHGVLLSALSRVPPLPGSARSCGSTVLH